MSVEKLKELEESIESAIKDWDILRIRSHLERPLGIEKIEGEKTK